MNAKLIRLFSLLAFFLLVLTGCSNANKDKEDIFDDTDPVEVEHTHTYSDAWSKDSQTHWHASTCEHTGLRKDESAHTFKVEEIPATYESEGSRTYTCTICYYSKTETIEKLNHNYSETFEYDNYHHWHNCIDKGYENVKKDIEDHVFVTSIKDPTFEEAGLKTSTCNKCGYSYSVELPPLSHSYSEEWDSDSKGHWHNCIDEGYGELRVDYAEHRFEKTKEDPTYEEVGHEIYTCKDCGYSYSIEIDKLEHHYATSYSSDDKGHWYACIDKGYETLQNGYQLHNYKVEVVEPTYSKKGYSIYTCSDCGYKYIGDEVEMLIHNHSDEWTNDTIGHWHACTDEGYENLKIEYSQHNYDSEITKNPTVFDDGIITNTCVECGFSYIEKIDSIYKQSIKATSFELVNDEYYRVTKIGASITKVYIPDEYNGLPVREIGNNCFSNNVTEIHLGKNITSVDYWSIYYRCPLLEVLESNDYFTSLPFYVDGLNNLKTIIVGKNFNSIPSFSNNNALDNIIVSEDNETFKSIDGALYSKDLSTLYFYSRVREETPTFPESLSSISSYAFYHSSIKNIDIPSTVTAIYDNAFAYCNNLERVFIPSSVNTLNSRSFGNCEKLKEVTLDCSLFSYSHDIFANCNNIEIVNYGKNINNLYKEFFYELPITEMNIDPDNNNFVVFDKLIMNQSRTTLFSIFDYEVAEINIPSTVSYISSYAFSSSNVSKVAISSNIYLADGCFYKCDNLVEADLKSSGNDYLYRTFYMCTNIKKVTLPNNIYHISYETFYGCSSLEEVVGLSNAKKIAGNAFSGCDKLIHVQNGIKYVGDSNNQYYAAIGYTEDISKDLVLNENCKIISSYSFNYLYSKVDTVDIVNAEIIGEGAFVYSYFSSINLGNNLKSIEGNAFQFCSFTTIDFPNSLTRIEYGVFYYCQNLTALTIPKNVTYIGMDAFYGCYNLTSLTVDDENNYYFMYKGSLYQKNDSKYMIFSTSRSGNVIVWKECHGAYWYFTYSDNYQLNNIFFEYTFEEYSQTWFYNNYTNDKFDNANKYYYSETYSEGAWHYVEGEPTLWN